MYKLKSKYYKNSDTKKILELIKSAITEDVRTGDITSNLFIPPGHKSKAVIIAK